MKINAKGSVTFSVRKEDQDLYDFIASLPEGVGSDIIRSLIRDGIAHQKQVNKKNVFPSHFHMLCKLRRMSAEELIQPYHGDNPPPAKVSRKRPATKSKSTVAPVKKSEQANLQEESKQGATPSEAIEETTATVNNTLPPEDPVGSDFDNAFDVKPI